MWGSEALCLKKPSQNYKVKSDVSEAPVIIMPDISFRSVTWDSLALLQGSFGSFGPRKNARKTTAKSCDVGLRCEKSTCSLIRQVLVSVKFVSAILGPEMAAPILWTPGKMRPFCRKNHVHKTPRFRRGGGILGLGGGSADFIFMGARIFLI